MTVSEPLTLVLPILRDEIIAQLEPIFTSHQFIEQYAKRFSNDYASFLKQYISGDPYQKVNAQIGIFLSKNADELGIQKNRRKRDVNVHGTKSVNQEWRHISS